MISSILTITKNVSAKPAPVSLMICFPGFRPNAELHNIICAKYRCVPDGNLQRYSCYLRSGCPPQLILWCYRRSGAKSYSEMDRIALTQTKNLLCITAFNQISIAEFHDRLRLEYFTDVLNGRFIDENNILTRGHELGYNIRMFIVSWSSMFFRNQVRKTA